jgi:hypothetical protein
MGPLTLTNRRGAGACRSGRPSPAPAAKAVRAHRRTLELSLDALKAGAAEPALASAKGRAGAQDALAALYLKIRAIEFEIECNHAACELAAREDAAADVAWLAAIQTMDPGEIVAGLGRDACCRRCTPGIPGGCVITAAAPYASSTCGHPVKERHLFHRDAEGRRIFPYRDNPQASKIFDAACRKLKVSGEFAWPKRPARRP